MKKIIKFFIIILAIFFSTITNAETKKIATNDNIFNEINYQKNVAV
jgi:hypothetical protein